MAKYNKTLSNGGNTNNNDSRFNESVKRLNNFIAIKEMDRRHWQNENFGSPEGALFKIMRVLIPIFSLYTIASLVIYCAIRDTQYLLSTLQNGYNGLSYDADVSNVTLIIYLVGFLAVALFAGNIILLFKKYYVGGFITGGSSLIITVHVFSQLWIPMPEENYQYITLFSISCAVYFILTLMCVYILFCLFKSKQNAKKITNEILGKISRGSKDLLSTEDYCDKIDKYIEKEKNKIVDEMKNRDHDFLRFDYSEDAENLDDDED